MTLRTTIGTLAALGALAASACGGSKAPKYANDGDTGAAAPATTQSLSPNPALGDTTPPGSGTRAAAGDTMGATGKAAGMPDSTAGHGRRGAPKP